MVWYPAAPGSRETDWTVSIFNAGTNAQGAPMAAEPAKLPLVLLSHGTGGAASTLGWLAEALAANGYIVAGVNHHGNTGAEPSYRLEGFMAWWDRPQDISAVLDKLLADPRFGPRIDTSRIGMAGFSLGGYTTLATIGVRLSQKQWQDFCAEASPDNPNCKLPPEIASKYSMDDVNRLLTQDERMKKELERMGNSFRDPRIRSAYAIAPVLGPAYVKDSVAGIQVPLRIVVGTADDQAIPETTAKPVAALVPKAQLQLLPGVTHYAFLSTCTMVGRTVARQICSDPEGVDRSAVHRQVGADAVQFFERTLR
ncbi:alpha/beta hydrolase family protein [Piscinibacter terrae]|uniref:alpha/beta hydrolase family protein n=1 Tax=Piscinibacter terrae TaxID=2496871 RepID=UPI001F1F6025|nr:prolyl oligopeptidase family serine peptidase [Albitalea terrae]